ncbi:MAG: hypothetical protein P4L41_06575 [Flavipsychrobacter sp.]|nr:hypothetical protein [Flavipsychrobacter sp.]
MANNPISIGVGGDFVPLNINATDAITVSITIKLLDAGWQYNASHLIVIAGKDKYNNNVEPSDLPLGNGSTLKGEKMGISSQVTQIRNGAATAVPSKVLYTVEIKANGVTLQSYSNTSGTDNPVDFITKLQFV